MKITITLLAVICARAQNTRYLAQTKDGKFHSIKLETNSYDIMGETEIEESQLDDREFNTKWIEKSKNWYRLRKAITKHLAKYKTEILNIAEQGYWTSNFGEKQWYNHILPNNCKEKNLIESKYTKSLKETYEDVKSKNRLHRGFKNLNSSQAFAFNFFQPIIDENLFEDFLDFWHNDSKPKCEFEKEETEDKTQFDFFLSANDKSCSFEVKYTEQYFGDAPMDKEHQNKWENLYKEKMNALCGKNAVSNEEFFENYQLWRNILFAAKPGRDVCFLYPKFRKDLSETVESAREKCGQVKESIHILYADDFVKKVLDDKGSKYSPELKAHYAEFKRKYLEEIE